MRCLWTLGLGWRHSWRSLPLALLLSLGLLSDAAAKKPKPPPPPPTPPPVVAGAISQTPLSLTTHVKPLVMLNLSNDHQLYFAAYNEYTDVDEDGIVDRTYEHTFNYYGYFDSFKCYNYSSGVFTPASYSADKYCAGNWSGNFLNWVTMARIDVVRKVLYGGLRSTDSSTSTILERSYLPNDAHSWARHYNGGDLNQLTPFNPPSTAPTSLSTNSTAISSGTGSRTFKSSFATTNVQVGDQMLAVSGATRMVGVVTGFNTTFKDVTINFSVAPAISGSSKEWNLTNLSRTGLTFCNTTVASGLSQSVTDPPLLRVAQGNYALWAANERWQCRWGEEKAASNANNVATSGLFANDRNPVKASVGLGNNDYTVRVKVCDPALLGEEFCQQYPSGNYKPSGLLQLYGDEDSLYFGLMTGSYVKNKSGGVLRKNIVSLQNEINVATDGTFKTPSSGGSIIGSLNKLRIFGYDHSDGTYNSADNCSWGLSSFTDGKCTNWGNPQSEIFLESLRYFAGKSANSAFTFSGDDKIPGLGLTSWSDPLSSTNYCSPLNIINFNASLASYDTDQLGDATDLPGGASASSLTDVVGAGEGIHGKSWFIGESGSSTNQLCTPKSISSLGNVKGLCPEAPRLQGGYSLAGLAHFAYKKDMRPDLTGSQNIMTYGVALAPGVPKIEIPRPGETKTAVTILPACRNSSVSGNCAIVDFKMVAQDLAAGTGSFFVQWEDSEQGGDYDQDMNGILSYQITASTIAVTTNTVAQSTGDAMGFGYVISGTGNDGFHVHSGINNFNFSDSSGAPGCSNCALSNNPTTANYNLGSGAAGVLEQPLYYAAKWGGYNKAMNFPAESKSWDRDGDGKPDNYAFASDPSKLEDSLNEAFYKVADAAISASAVASNSTRLDSGSMVYQARFDSKRWSGELLAFPIDDGESGGTQGSLKPSIWDAAKKIPAHGSRKIFTFNAAASPKGVSFAWGSLNAAQQAALNDNPDTPALDNDGKGALRLAYLRGDLSNEAPSGAGFRSRASLLGDIVNSNPLFLGRQNFGFEKLPGAEGTSYKTFRESTAYTGRSPMLYVGANDGMLHAFDAVTGVEKFAYVPNGVFANLNQLSGTNYKHLYFVDGAPRGSDAYVGGQWRTYLLGSLAAGGKSIFALDVTSPESFSSGDIKWEFTDAADLGFTFSQPTIARLASGDWVAIFGNGYQSANQKAVLFILNLADGTVLKKIDTGVGSAIAPNGLSTPVPVDLDGDRITDLVYAGDLQGNLWKFDLSGSSHNQWEIAFKAGTTPLPLYTARDGSGKVQPITARPAVGRHKEGGEMVYFGTGQYYMSDDNIVSASGPVQSFYGIWDKKAPISQTNRSGLQPQTITAETFAFGRNVRLVSKNPIDWAAKLGWYLDLSYPSGSLTGERAVSMPLLRHGRVIFVTLIPSTLPCLHGGESWLMEVDALSGGRLGESVFDLNQDDVFNQNDDVNSVPVSGLASEQGIIQTPGIIEAGEVEYKYTTGSTGGIGVTKEKGGSGAGKGRRSWIQLR